MNTKHKLLTFLTALAMLMPISAVGQDKDVLIDKDFAITDGTLEGFGAKGHLKLTKNDFIITIPAQNLKAEREDRRAGYTLIEKGSCTDITIQGKCKMIEKEWENSEGRIVRDTWFVIDGEYSVGPKEWRYEMNEDYMKKGFKTGQIYRDQEHKEKQTRILASKCSPIKKDEKFVYFEQGENGEVFHVKITIESLNCFDQNITNHYEEDGTLNEYYSDGDVWYDSGDINYGETFYLPFEGEGSCAGTMFAEGDSIDAPAIHEEDNEASEESGTMKFLIPIAVAVAVGGAVAGAAAGGVAAYRKRLRKKKERESQGQEDENSEEEQEEEKEPDDLRMDLYKDFGDTLVVGDAAQQVCACIVRMPKNGAEFTDEGLTRQIQITSGDDYLVVEDGEIVNGWKTSYVYAPEMDSPPEEGIVKFTIASAEGSYTNKIHFKIVKYEVLFGQENLTIPARCDIAMRLPFAVVGFEGEKGVTAYITENGKATEDYSVEVEWDDQAKHYYAVIRDQLFDPEKDEGIPGKWVTYQLHVEAENDCGMKVEGALPVLRFYMGLTLELKSHGDVGCYITEYDPMNHRTHLKNCYKVNGKAFMPEENEATLVLYDYDYSINSLLKVAPVPLPKDGFVVKAKDETKQELVDKLGFSIEPLNDQTSVGRLCLIRCLKGILDAPNRIDAEGTVKVKYKGPNDDVEKVHSCTFTMRLCSQKRRAFQNMEEWNAARKRDHHVADRLQHIIDNIVAHGQMDRMFPLAKFTHMQLEGYDEAFGYDARNVARIQRTYTDLLTGEIGGVGDDLPPEETLSDAMGWWYNAWKKVGDDLGIGGRIIAGYGTWGISELIFTPIDFVEEMHDYVYNKNGDSALDMFWIGVKNGAFIVMTVASTASTLKAKNVTRLGLKQALANAKKGFAKPYNTLKGWLYRDACQKSAQATQKAATLSEMQLKAAKNAPVMAGDLCLDEGMKAGRARGIDKVKRLRAAIELENANPCKANRMLKNQLVMEVQGDKQAMYILNTAGEGYDVVRAEFNGSLKKVYNQVDDLCKKEFQKKYPGKKIMIENASASSADDLVRGKKVTMDRDTTYYFMEGDKKIYLPQDEVVEIYNRNFYKAARQQVTGQSVQTSASKSAQYEKYARKMDQTVIEAVETHPESYGKDWKKLADKSLRGEALDNATKVGDAMTYKGAERFKEAEKILAEARKMPAGAERLYREADAVNEYMEGLRQLVKQFNNYVKPYDIARYTTNGTSMIPQHMREAVDMASSMFKKGSTISIDQLQRAFRAIGYDFYQFADDMGACMKRICTPKSWEVVH